MHTDAKIVLKKGKEGSLKRFHPWVFSGAIHAVEGNVSDGSWVSVVSADGEALGYGHYQPSSIAIRMLSFSSTEPGEGFYLNRISNALKLRNASQLPSEETNAFRLVHGEGDGLSGLIIDVYNDVAIIQSHSAGMHKDRSRIVEALQQALPFLTGIYYKSQSTLPGTLKEGNVDGYLLGNAQVPKIITENAHRFHVNWEDGQKTGFFLDQRDNRKLLASFCKSKKVLNAFCFTGGFSVYALNGGASLVHSVDASEKAIELARKNIALNGFDPLQHTCYVDDVFDFLKKDGEYDVMVLDPPAFAKHREAKHQAMKGYQRLNASAMRAIRPGGIIFTFSCSQVIDKKLFYDTIVSASIQAGRDIKVLHHLSQPADHPISAFHPEGEYLKGLVLYVA